MVVRVAVTEIFRNCPRYVHRYDKVTRSQYVPRDGGDTPLAAGSASMTCKDVCRPGIAPCARKPASSPRRVRKNPAIGKSTANSRLV